MTDFGLIGHPVGHSMSKVMHEAAFTELGLEYTYGLYDVKIDELKLFMDNALFKGLNVTIPLKTAIQNYTNELSEEARVIGSVNTVDFKKKLIGHNTDVIGFMKMLEENDLDVKDRTYLVLGAGGAGRGITFKLALEGARVYLYDIDKAKSTDLADDVLKKTGIRVEPIPQYEDIMKKIDVLVNATPVGMYPKVDDIPITARLLNKTISVVDIVYNPAETRLLRQARAIGCQTINGVSMLVQQGAESLKIWLDIDPPTDIMEEVVIANL